MPRLRWCLRELDESDELDELLPLFSLRAPDRDLDLRFSSEDEYRLRFFGVGDRELDDWLEELLSDAFAGSVSRLLSLISFSSSRWICSSSESRLELSDESS